MAAAAIEFQGVSKVYKRWFSEERVEALSNVSFAVAQGEVCAFLGPNGAGKTTSIGILMGFHFANTGTVRVLGHAPGDIRVKEQIGFLPENFAFYKYLTGPKLLRLHRALAGRTAAGDEALIAELLAKAVKLAGYENLKIGRYSRGHGAATRASRRRCCATRKLVILDEPTSGLDPAGRREVLQLLVSLKAEGKTVFLSSHILPEVEQICDRVVILDHGKLIRTGRLNEMLGSNTAVEIVVESLSAEMEGAARAARRRNPPNGARCEGHYRSGAQAGSGRGVVGRRLRCGQSQPGEKHAGRGLPADGGRKGGRVVKIRAIAFNTFNGLLRNKIIILFCAGMVCVMLLALTPLMLARNNRNIGPDQMQAMVLQIIGGIMGLVSGFGSLLAAWAAADAVSGEMKSGTILAVMARPVRRWEFLLGKYLGVQLLMVSFVLAMLALNYVMAAIGGVHIQVAPWLLIVYPLVRYAIFSAIALMLVTVMHPIIAFGIVMVMSIAAQIVAPSATPPQFMAPWVRKTLFDIVLSRPPARCLRSASSP